LPAAQARPVAFRDHDPLRKELDLPVLFPPVSLDRILGQVVSERGMRQLRTAETEKYAHVTYFFNGGQETPFPGEDRELLPSPKDVPTYDFKPEMSVYKVTDTLVAALESGQYDMVVCNFANLDMVGHTGVIPAAIKACEAVDECLGRVMDCVAGSAARFWSRRITATPRTCWTSRAT
jgi:2,3-bisphosphoglycerate-independent phosphoglycerate mutase